MNGSGRRIARWLLLDGNRHAVAGLLVAGVFAALTLLGLTGVIAVEEAAVRGIAGGFVPGLIAFLSIVLAINQLVLSQELGSAGEIRERIEEVREYRLEVEEIAGTGPSPILPTTFLAFVVGTIEVEARELEASAEVATESGARSGLEAYARRVVDEASSARASLERVRSGRINALLPVLAYDDAGQLYEARRLRDDADDLPEETRAAISRLVDALELFGVARSQFRSTYTQRTLARLSRQLLYTGFPALILVVVLGLLELPSGSGDPSLTTVVVVSGLLSLTLTPLAVLAAYLLRIATISERTIAVGPFVSRPNGSGTENPIEPEE